jgi:hypothetical protein
MGVIFMTTMFTGFLLFTTVLPVMGGERAVFYREKAAGMYSVSSFNFVLGLVEAPYIAGSPPPPSLLSPHGSTTDRVLLPWSSPQP